MPKRRDRPRSPFSRPRRVELGTGEASYSSRAVVSEREGGRLVQSESLARQCFEAGRDPDFPRRFKELLHPDVAVSVRTADGEWVEGAEAVGELLDRNADAPVFQAADDRYLPIDEERVVVEGRLRWMDEGRTLRDEPAIWALEFRDGLLYRSITVRSVAEAEAVLAAGRASPAD